MCFDWWNAQAVQCCFFQPLQLHLRSADLLEQLRILGLALIIVPAFLARIIGLAGTLQELLLPLAHLDGMHAMVSGNLLEGLATTDRFHGHLGLKLRTVGTAFAHRWEPPFKGGAQPQRLKMGPVQISQTTSISRWDHCLRWPPQPS